MKRNSKLKSQLLMTKSGSQILTSLLSYMTLKQSKGSQVMMLCAKSPFLMKTSQVLLVLRKLRLMFKKDRIMLILSLPEAMAQMEPSNASSKLNSSLM
jgi:hypothetical protein